MNLLFWKRQTVEDPKSTIRRQMPSGYTMLCNGINYAYLRKKDNWLNYSFKTPEDCINRAWEDFETCNYRDSEGNTYRHYR